MNLERAVGKAVSIPIYTWTKRLYLDKKGPSINYVCIFTCYLDPLPLFACNTQWKHEACLPLPPLGVYVTNGSPQMGNNFEGILR